jgi:hypothetical protein
VVAADAAGKRPRVTASRSSLLRAAACALAALAAAGCVSHSHAVGLGPTGTGEQSDRQFYLLFGLVPLNTVESQRLAGDLTSYTIETGYSFTDLLLTPLLLPLTVTSRTVVVRT